MGNSCESYNLKNEDNLTAIENQLSYNPITVGGGVKDYTRGRTLNYIGY